MAADEELDVYGLDGVGVDDPDRDFLSTEPCDKQWPKLRRRGSPISPSTGSTGTGGISSAAMKGTIVENVGQRVPPSDLHDR